MRDANYGATAGVGEAGAGESPAQAPEQPTLKKCQDDMEGDKGNTAADFLLKLVMVAAAVAPTDTFDEEVVQMALTIAKRYLMDILGKL